MVSQTGNRLEDRNPPEYHLMTLNRAIRALMETTLEPYGLKLVEWRLLQSLEDGDAKTICDLSVLAVIERTVTGRLVDKLVTRNLITKTSLETDRRASLISLTHAGHELLSKCAADVEAARNRLFHGLSQQQIGELLSILEIMQANAADAFQSAVPAQTAAHQRPASRREG